jgi:hypothetical protein
MKPKLDIKKFFPCKAGQAYYDRYETFEEAWQKCRRADWMLWIALALGVSYPALAGAKARCAGAVAHLMDEACAEAVSLALRFADGEAEREETDSVVLRIASEVDLDASGASGRANAAAVAACWPLFCKEVVDFVAEAREEEAMALGGDRAAATSARKASLRQMAGICREALTAAVYEKVKR